MKTDITAEPNQELVTRCSGQRDVGLYPSLKKQPAGEGLGKEYVTEMTRSGAMPCTWMAQSGSLKSSSSCDDNEECSVGFLGDHVDVVMMKRGG